MSPPGRRAGRRRTADRHRRTSRRGRSSYTSTLVEMGTGAWAHALAFTVLAVVAVTGSAPGRYVGENRFDQYFAPGHRLVRSLFLWDPTRGMGATREDLWPVQVGPLAALRGLGLDAVATQRVWHVALLVAAASGAAAVLRTVRGPDAPVATGFGPFLAGLIYAFGPYSLTFFTPTNLYVAYVAAPWVVLCALRGPVSTRPWRTAAAAALIVGGLGNTDIPGVVMAMAVVPAVAVWASIRAGVGWRPGAAWLVRAGALGLAVSAASLWKTWAGASVLAQRVGSTEAPETVGVASSWTESLRGMGFWLSYYRGPELARPQGADLFSEPVVVLATFVPILLALAALLLPEVRSRALWGLCIVGAGAVMVGLHPVTDPVPLGSLLAGAFQESSTLSGFRSTYKAGAGLMIAVAVLGALATEAIAARAERRRRGATALRIGAVALVLLAGLPFWSGDLYDPETTAGPIPEYWRVAADTINELPGEGRILVLPASTRSIYRWGWVGDDILDSLITRPQATDVTIALSTPEAADLLAAVSEAVDDARYEQGSLAVLLRRLGIDHVLVRNDLDVERTRTIPPSRLSLLRADPTLERIGAFGTRDETSTTRVTSSSGDDTGDLPLLELYALADPGPVGPRVAPADAAVVVSGSGAALPGLAGSGALDEAGPVRYAPTLEGAELVDALETDGQLVVSDTNRRRVTVVNSLVRDESWTLAAGEDLDREADALFDQPGSQTVAWYRDATRISSTGFPRGTRGSQPWTRPAMAFDGDPNTAWQTVELDEQVGIALRVDLRRAEAVDTVRVDPAGAPEGARRIAEVVLRFSDGTTQELDVAGGAAEVAVDVGTSRWVEIVISRVTSGPARPVGLREVTLGGLDLREWIQMPDDLARAADRSAEVAEAIDDAPLTVTMVRDQPEAPFPVEPRMRRRLRLAADRRVVLGGSVTPFDSAELLATREMEEGCVDGIVEVDGESVPMTLARGAAVVLGRSVEVRSCGSLELDPGWHELVVDADSSLDRIRLDEGRPAQATDPDGRVVVRHGGPDRMRLTVDAPDGGVLVTGESFDERWVATADGRDLGAATPYDTQSGWRLPEGRGMDVHLEFRPARIYRASVWLSLVAAGLCVVLVVRRPPVRRRDDDRSMAPPG